MSPSKKKKKKDSHKFLLARSLVRLLEGLVHALKYSHQSYGNPLPV